MDQQRDFFISYTGADQAWAEWIADTLEQDGHTTLLQAWDFRPGSDFVEQMHQAIQQTKRTIAVLSQRYLASVFAAAEWHAVFAKDPTGQAGLLVPVRIEDCAPPGLLWTRVYIDLVGLDEQAAAERPRAGLGYGRAKPTGRRPYPGAPARAGAASFPGRRPAIFNVPPRNPHFAGRCDLLAMLRRHLTEKSTGAVVQAGAVHGLGGVGKTQLAIEYAHRYGADYDLVWWIRRNARRRRAAIVFWDEAGVSFGPRHPTHLGATRPHPGHPPPLQIAAGVHGRGVVLRVGWWWRAAGVPPPARRLRHRHPDRRAGGLRRFLSGQKATLLWDGLPAHRSKRMRGWLRCQLHWLVVEPLPSYALELNPVEAL